MNWDHHLPDTPRRRQDISLEAFWRVGVSVGGMVGAATCWRGTGCSGTDDGRRRDATNALLNPSFDLFDLAASLSGVVLFGRLGAVARRSGKGKGTP